MNLTNAIKLIGLFTLLSLLTNCQKDKDENNYLHEHPAIEHSGNRTITRSGIEDLKSDPDFIQLTSIYELEELIYNDSNNKSTNGLVDLNDGNFLVPDTINKINKEGYVSYTFLIKNPKDSLTVVRNLILEKKQDTTRAYYLNYKLDKDWITELNDGNGSPPRGKVRIEVYKGDLNPITSRTVCNYVNITVIIPCGCGDYSPSVCRGCDSSLPRYPSSSTILVQVCADGSEGDLWEMESNEDEITGGGSGGGTGGDADSDSMMNLPVDELQKAGLILTAKTNLTDHIAFNDTQLAWLDVNGDQVLLLNTLLITNEYSATVKSTIKTIIDVAKGNLELKEKVIEIKMLLSILEPKLSQNIPRSTYIQRIVGINNFLRTHGHEDFAAMMDQVIEVVPGFTNEELYDFYSFMYNMGRKVQASFMVAVIMPFVEAAQILVEFALIDTGITLAVKLLQSLPPLLKSIEITEVIKTMETSTKLSEFKYAQKFGFKSYNEHDKFFKGLNINRSEKGIQIHHLIEQRFASRLGILDTNQMQSIVLTVEEHATFTRAWRSKIGYGGDNVAITTANATFDDIYGAAREIYEQYPEILLALGL